MCVEPRDLGGEPATYGQHIGACLSAVSMQIAVDTHAHMNVLGQITAD